MHIWFVCETAGWGREAGKPWRKNVQCWLGWLGAEGLLPPELHHGWQGEGARSRTTWTAEGGGEGLTTHVVPDLAALIAVCHVQQAARPLSLLSSLCIPQRSSSAQL